MRKWFRTAMTATLVATLGGCTSEVPAIAPSQLTGRWGGSLIEVRDSAVAHGIVVDVGCSNWLFPAPVAVDSLGAFLAYGAIVRDAYPPNVGRRTRISGRLVGDSLALDGTVTLWADPTRFAEPPGHRDLKRGRAPDWTGLICES